MEFSYILVYIEDDDLAVRGTTTRIAERKETRGNIFTIKRTVDWLFRACQKSGRSGKRCWEMVYRRFVVKNGTNHVLRAYLHNSSRDFFFFLVSANFLNFPLIIICVHMYR